MKINIGIEIPLRPNFIRTNLGMLPISDFSEKELRNIGKDWTKLLIEKRSKRLSVTPASQDKE